MAKYGDENEVLADGEILRVPLTMMDSMQRGIAQLDASGWPAGHRRGYVGVADEAALREGALEKAAVVSELEVKIDRLERQEEALITAAAEQGIEILRRSNASPMAVLGLVVAVASTAQAAA